MIIVWYSRWVVFACAQYTRFAWPSHTPVEVVHESYRILYTSAYCSRWGADSFAYSFYGYLNAELAINTLLKKLPHILPHFSSVAYLCFQTSTPEIINAYDKSYMLLRRVYLFFCESIRIPSV